MEETVKFLCDIFAENRSMASRLKKIESLIIYNMQSKNVLDWHERKAMNIQVRVI
jgi:hypothetical protein